MQAPDLLGLQTESFNWLIGSPSWRAGAGPDEKSGLEEIFEEVSPIENSANTMKLSFSEPKLEDPKYTVEMCKEKDLTYSAPLYVKADFYYKETGEIKSQTTFLGDFPLP